MTDDFHRTNINLRRSDVEYLRIVFGHGWTEKVREWVTSGVTNHRLVNATKTNAARQYKDLPRG